MNTPIQNITVRPVRLTNESGSSFLLRVGETTADYQKDSLYNNAKSEGLIRDVSEGDTKDPDTSVEVTPVESETDGKEEAEDTSDNDADEGSGLGVGSEELERVTEEYSEDDEDNDPLSDLSEGIVDALSEGGLDTSKKVRDASDEELMELDGIGESRVEKIRDLIG